MIMEGGGSWMPDNTVEPSGGVVGLIQLNTDEGRCLLENPSEMLTKGSFVVVVVSCCSGSMIGQSCCCVYQWWATENAGCTVKEGLYGSWGQHTAHAEAVSSQLCVAVVSCCSGSIVGQFLYWLGG